MIDVGVTWDFSWACGLHTAFHVAGWPLHNMVAGFQEKYPKKTKGNCITYSNLDLEVTKHHFHSIHALRQLQIPSQVQRERKYIPPLDEQVARF